MIYTIKSIPTVYACVNFRSRLEARWAAFFDLAGIDWDYEPFDMDGWAPDFLVRSSGVNILAEVKPVDFGCEVTVEMAATCEKAVRHHHTNNVLLLGISPLNDGSIGVSIEQCPPVSAPSSAEKWRLAGNPVQWLPGSGEPEQEDYHIQMRRIFGRKAA